LLALLVLIVSTSHLKLKKYITSSPRATKAFIIAVIIIIDDDDDYHHQKLIIVSALEQCPRRF
jgi:hypothetical protein